MIKKVLIHFGPPKTGSSALQKWLNENQNILRRHSIYYPSHDADANGVSSGNVECVCSIGKDGLFFLDQNKVDKLISDFKQSSYEVLLLSSEAFFRLLEPIAKSFPDSLLVGYIRDPLGFKESIYNQSVKRHGNNKNIELPKQLGWFQLKRFETLLSSIGVKRFKLLAYLPPNGTNHDVVTEFLDILQIKHSYTKNVIVNNSYCHEALQFRRQLNAFKIGPIEHELDLILQGYQLGTKDYTYIPNGLFESYKTQCEQVLTDFSSRYDVENMSVLIKSIKNRKTNVYIPQELSDEALTKLILYIRNGYPESYLKLCVALCGQSSESIENDCFKAKIIGTLKCHISYSIIKVLFWGSSQLKTRVIFLINQISALLSGKGT